MFIFPIGYEKAGDEKRSGDDFSISMGTVRRIPWVTIFIVATCFLAFIPVSGLIPMPEDFNPALRWGLIPAAPRAATFITHMFMHGGWLHILGNMVFLFCLGGPLEDRWGRPLFGSLYLIGGLVAATTHVLLTTGSAIPMVGASGAIAAVMGAFAVRFWNYRIRYGYIFLLGIFPIRGSFRAPAWLTLLLFFSLDVLGAARSFFWGQSDSIAYWAHVGGFAFGLCVAGIVTFLKVEERFIDPAIEERVTVFRGNPLLENAAAMRLEGRLDEAYELLEPAVRKNPEDPDLVLVFWNIAKVNDKIPDAVPVVGRLMRKLVASGEVQIAADYWCELGSDAAAVRLDAGGYTAIGTELLAQDCVQPGVEALRYGVAEWVRGFDGAVAVKVMEAVERVDPRVALRAANRGLSLPGLSRKHRVCLKQMQVELTAAGVQEADDPTRVKMVVDSEPLVSTHEPQLEESATVAEASVELSSIRRPQYLQAGEDAPARMDEELLAFGATVCLPRFSGIKPMDAVPENLGSEGISLLLPTGKRARLPYTKIDAVGVGAVHGIKAKPVLVIDLVLNWTDLSEEILKVVRFRSDHFSPRKLMRTNVSAMEAARGIIQELAARSEAIILPESGIESGSSIKVYADLTVYEREVLQVEC